jgi:hypothetical protein
VLTPAANNVPGANPNLGNAEATRIPVTPFTTTPEATLAGQTLTNVVTSTGVGSDDCAVGITSFDGAYEISLRRLTQP